MSSIIPTPLHHVSKAFSSLSNKVAARLYDALALLEAKQTGLQKKFIHIGELNLAIWQRGPQTSKHVLILIHGYTADKNIWVRFTRALSQDIRIIIPDMAGHGETGWQPSWDFSPHVQAQRLKLLMDRLGIDQAVLVGNSMGGSNCCNICSELSATNGWAGFGESCWSAGAPSKSI